MVAPYATALAALVHPTAAAANLRRLAREGLLGSYGYFDAIDYTPRRPEESEADAAVPEHGRSRGTIVRAFLAHHQGMTLTALAGALTGNRMVERFHADPRVQATELLLQERVPRHAAVLRPRPDEGARIAPPVPPAAVRRFRSPHTAFPHAQFLSNGNYTVVVTNAGGGASFCRGRAVTRRRQDPTRDPGGQYLYLRDVRSGRVWSATHHPTARDATDDLVAFTMEKATFQRTDDEIGTRLDVAVSPEDDVEVRRLEIVNHGDRARELEITSYAEIVLAPNADDLAHPSFGKLFVESEYVAESSALLCRRRPRGPDDSETFAVHVIGQEGRTQGPVEWESDRGRFLGRGRGPEDPQALDGRPLSGTTGVAARSHREPAAARPARAGRRREALVRDRDGRRAGRPPWRSRSATAIRPRPRGPSRSRSRTRGAACTTSASAATRPSSSSASPRACCTTTPRSGPGPRSSPRNALGQEGLWGHGVSGDLPVLLVRVVSDSDLGLVRQVLQAQEYWRLKGLAADVVVLNEHPISYLDEVQAQLAALLDGGPWRTWKHRAGGVYLLRADRMPEAERLLLVGVARAVLDGESRVARAPARSARTGPALDHDPQARAGREPRPDDRPHRPAARPSARARERARRLRRGRAGVRRRARGRRGDAAALGQRHREPGVRDDRHRVGLVVHLVREQPREPAHALRERPDHAIRPPRPCSSATTTTVRPGPPRRGRCRATERAAGS